MGDCWRTLKRHALWFLALLLIDLFASLLLWLADIPSFRALLASIVLATLLLFAVVFCIVLVQGQKKRQAFYNFLYHADEYQEEMLLNLCSEEEGQMIRLLGQVLREKEEERAQLLERVSDYEEYVESWAHETKIPLSLLTVLLDNRREQMPENISFKLDIVRNRLQEAVSQILFYARLKGVRKDYLFEDIVLEECIEDVLEDYRPLLEEKEFEIFTQVSGISVYCDKRCLAFLLSQFISNAVKYNDKKKAARIEITSREDTHHLALSIRDNGMGVRCCDLPYIFEKGFTGNSEEARKRATGMGLYLAKAIADDCKIKLEAYSVWGEGFEMRILFPLHG